MKENSQVDLIKSLGVFFQHNLFAKVLVLDQMVMKNDIRVFADVVLSFILVLILNVLIGPKANFTS